MACIHGSKPSRVCLWSRRSLSVASFAFGSIVRLRLLAFGGVVRFGRDVRLRSCCDRAVKPWMDTSRSSLSQPPAWTFFPTRRCGQALLSGTIVRRLEMDDGRWTMAAGRGTPDMVVGMMRSRRDQTRLAQTLQGSNSPAKCRMPCVVSLDVVRLGVIRSDLRLS
jgi:hypothetical protein